MKTDSQTNKEKEWITYKGKKIRMISDLPLAIPDPKRNVQYIENQWESSVDRHKWPWMPANLHVYHWAMRRGIVLQLVNLDLNLDRKLEFSLSLGMGVQLTCKKEVKGHIRRK